MGAGADEPPAVRPADHAGEPVVVRTQAVRRTEFHATRRGTAGNRRIRAATDRDSTAAGATRPDGGAAAG